MLDLERENLLILEARQEPDPETASLLKAISLALERITEIEAARHRTESSPSAWPGDKCLARLFAREAREPEEKQIREAAAHLFRMPGGKELLRETFFSEEGGVGPRLGSFFSDDESSV